MRITTKAVFDIETMKLLEWEGFDYEGPLELGGGGPSDAQNQAAASQSALNNQLAGVFGKQEAFSEAQQQKANPFYTNLLKQGLPYYSQLTDAAGGDVARGFAPARAQLEQQLGQSPNALPSGFATGARSDLAANQGRAFDQDLQAAQGANLQAKQQGAAGLLGQAQIANPTAYSGQASQGNQAVMNAPLAKPGLGGLLGGLAGGLASAIPF
jgi:hypothetical protein